MAVAFPEVGDLAEIPTGDMPGDRVQIGESHVAKARSVFPVLWERLGAVLAASPHHRAVISVHGGSGVGKSEIGSLLAAGLNRLGVGAYVLSGDNYPRRVPAANDAERLRVFRSAALRGLMDAGLYRAEVRSVLDELAATGRDADPAAVAEHAWLRQYQDAGRAALADYLGSPAEIAFDELNAILAAFHGGASHLLLKRMGRTEDEL